MDTAIPRSLSMLPASVQKYFPKDVPFVRYGTHGDGTCFFHSVCAARNEQGYLAATPAEQKRIGRAYRCNFSKQLTDEVWNEFAATQGVKTTPEQARKDFCNSKHWANQEMIQFVSDKLGLNILFIDTDSSKLYCGVRGGSTEPLMTILWVKHAHFEPVGAVRKVRGVETGMQFMFDPVRDADVTDHIMNAYQGQCAV